jgi:predicted Fe-S protein YdhL (DUF1289 family)
MATIVSPCINVCVLDPETGLCRGCGRTVDEIASWARMNDAERKRIMAELPHRRISKSDAAPAASR